MSMQSLYKQENMHELGVALEGNDPLHFWI